ncbi:MAG: GAF and ANTAR domain-containing protein [Nocardioides sp.]
MDDTESVADVGVSWPAGPAAERVAALCASCIPGAGVDGGGVSVMTSAGTAVAVHASDQTSAAIEELQLTLGEGPCVDANAYGRPVLVADLANRAEGVAGRWPLFHDEASRMGVRAVFAFPIRIGVIGFGTLDLFRLSEGPLDDTQLAHALRVVDALAQALLDYDTQQDGDDLLSPQMVVHQAAGMVMVQMDSSIEQAMLRLRATAYAEGISINLLAAHVVSGRRTLQ